MQERPTLYTLVRQLFHQILLTFICVATACSASWFERHPQNTGNRYTQFLRDNMKYAVVFFTLYFIANIIRIIRTMLFMFVNKLMDLDMKKLKSPTY